MSSYYVYNSDIGRYQRITPDGKDTVIQTMHSGFEPPEGADVRPMPKKKAKKGAAVVAIVIAVALVILVWQTMK